MDLLTIFRTILKLKFSFVCDAPARSFLKGTKAHTGYSSCDRCVVRREYYKNKVVFNSLVSQKRTDESFRQEIDEDHHVSHTPLSELPIDLITTFPNDYMHNVCLGIVRKLLNTWIGGGSLKVRLQHQKVQVISQPLLDLRKMIPVEFNRKPRSLEELQYWKATELRTFLIYVGPIVLKDVVNIAVYENFLAFHFAISVLLSDRHIKNLGVALVRNIINVFIDHVKVLYGLEFMVYNVHLLSYICDDVDMFGVLDNFSAFPFENYLGQLKLLVKASINPLQQIHRRLHERNLLISSSNSQLKTKIELHFPHSRGPLISSNENVKWHKQFDKVNFYNVTFLTKNKSIADSYCFNMQGNKVMQIHNITKTHDNETYVAENTLNMMTFIHIPMHQVN